MSGIKVVPCLDIMDGRVTKGVQFAGMRDAGDPVECALRYAAEGADEIWLLDIRASVEGRSNRLSMLKGIVEGCRTPVCVGGGVRTLADMEELFAAGVAKVGVGSAALLSPDIIRRASYKYGRGRVTALVDVAPNDRMPSGREVLGAGQAGTDRDMVVWARQLEELGAGELLLTSMRDGTREGYDLDAIRCLSGSVAIPVIASGGAGQLQDFLDAVLIGGARTVLAASVFHFGTFTVGQVKEYLRSHGVDVSGGPGFDFDSVKWGADGLVPAIAVDALTGDVLMLAYMNRESLKKTLACGMATYFSRSRRALWTKGETSGNTQRVREILLDCDADTLLLKVEQRGPACHTGAATCFFTPVKTLEGQRSSGQGAGVLRELYGVILERKEQMPEGSYTASLFQKGLDHMLKKVGEEASEFLIAAAQGKRDEARYEAADLVYHMLAVFAQQGITPDELFAELSLRMK